MERVTEPTLSSRVAVISLVYVTDAVEVLSIPLVSVVTSDVRFNPSWDATEPTT